MYLYSLLQKWSPYLSRAVELEGKYPLVAYYCRLYVVENIMMQRSNSDYDRALDTLMMDTLHKCESVKSTLQLQLESGKEQMEDFCLAVFANADRSDRESPVQPPDVSLANRFYVASLFLDVLSSLHDGKVLPPDLDEKRKYAKYRTLQIRQRVPLVVDPAPVVVMDEVIPDTKPVETLKPPTPPAVVPVKPTTARPAASGFTYAESSSRTPEKAAPASRASAMAAKKKLLQAISSIEFADYSSAIELSQEAINLLR
jgi:hypothetical protein